MFCSFGDNEEYSKCRDAGGTVVSNVFCLPANYKKDVLPPTGGTDRHHQPEPITGKVFSSSSNFPNHMCMQAIMILTNHQSQFSQNAGSIFFPQQVVPITIINHN